jgi:hypothetical protein
MSLRSVDTGSETADAEPAARTRATVRAPPSAHIIRIIPSPFPEDTGEQTKFDAIGIRISSPFSSSKNPFISVRYGQAPTGRSPRRATTAETLFPFWEKRF